MASASSICSRYINRLDIVVEVFKPIHSGNRHDERLLREQPGEGNLHRRSAFPFGYILQHFNKRHVGFYRFPGEAGKSYAKIGFAVERSAGRVTTDGLCTLLYSHNKERLPGWSGVGRHLTRVIPPSMHAGIHELVEIFGLSECINSRFDQLSMGQQNRVNLIRYLLQDCDLLIMDESLANVDELTRENIILAIKAIFPQRYFIHISHNVMEVAKFCDSILVFRGRGMAPRTIMINDCNILKKEALSRATLDATLLEIMNAA